MCNEKRLQASFVSKILLRDILERHLAMLDSFEELRSRIQCDPRRDFFLIFFFGSEVRCCFGIGRRV
jgi:hypothetical protein